MEKNDPHLGSGPSEEVGTQKGRRGRRAKNAVCTLGDGGKGKVQGGGRKTPPPWRREKKKKSRGGGEK